MGYIKSKSNYVIKSKHQLVGDGTIFERDITSIGGLDQFAAGQVPIYKSGNFIITVNNEDNSSRNISNNKWEENPNGNIWTLDDVINNTDEEQEANSNFVLKRDYYSLRDFAYYGSCAELIRASINDIIKRFPGELYGTTMHSKGTDSGLIVYYKDTSTGVSETDATIKRLGGNNFFLLENPFDINMHIKFMNPNKIVDELKYFCNDGYKNYTIGKDNNLVEITSWEFEKEEDCINRKIGRVILNNIYTIYVYKGDNDIIYYLYEGNNMNNVHIRPKQEYYNKFIKSLDGFQQVLFNPNSEPKYKSTFEVITENDFGYKTIIQSFVMPIGNGGYNIGSNSIPFEIYLKDLSDVALFYDERFCDNLYRSMTHESIKNFDWTHRREYDDGEESEYVIGGDKIANLLRIYGRQLDDIKSYADNISNSNTLSYNDINNIPDYYLTDSLDNDGWDVKLIYPLNLAEYIIKDKKKVFRDIIDNNFKNTFGGVVYGEVSETSNSVGSEPNKLILNRLFNQDLNMSVKPYSKNLIEDYPNGYFNSCCNGGEKKPSDGSTNTYVDECAVGRPILRPLIKLYSNEKEYTTTEINNQFMKRLRLNSKQLLRSKGTLNGVEMILSLFGLKSKRWYDSLSDEMKFKYKKYDFEIIEYTSFTNPIIDYYDNDKKMCKYDWYNSTKMVQYDTTDYMNGIYVAYQGLPLISRKLTNNNVNIYPYFDKDMIYDGNPYYQMKGGWLSKEPFQFDKDNSIVTGGSSVLYTETLRTVKSVGSLIELTTVPMQTLNNGDIYFVNNINNKYAIIDGQLYDLKTEEYNGNVYNYFSVYTSNNSVNIGDVYFYDYVNVSVPFNANKTLKVSLNEIEDNTEIKVYYIDNKFVAEGNGLTINNYDIYENGNSEGLSVDKNIFTHYFRINNVEYKSEISLYGWEQLINTDKDYYRLNAIVDYYKGNNPHNGNFSYDNGYEYLTYFKQLFKYAYNNELFDKRCYGDTYYEDLDKISKVGFSGLVNGDECDTDYTNLMNIDSKIHYFGNFYANGNVGNKNIFSYPTTPSKTNVTKYDYEYTNDKNILKGNYNLKNVNKVHSTNSDTTDYYGNTGSDYITNQIVNNKRIDINFVLDTLNYDKTHLERIKYIDSVIVPYLEQLIPSTAICKIKYKIK